MRGHGESVGDERELVERSGTRMMRSGRVYAGAEMGLFDGDELPNLGSLRSDIFRG